MLDAAVSAATQEKNAIIQEKNAIIQEKDAIIATLRCVGRYLQMVDIVLERYVCAGQSCKAAATCLHSGL